MIFLKYKKYLVAVLLFIICQATYSQSDDNPDEMITYDHYSNNVQLYELASGEQGIEIFNDEGEGPGLYLVMGNDGNARMGVGTNDPEYHFTNVGTTLCKEITIMEFDIASVPDYVFEEGYNLRSLAQVEKYIKENKHLPGIPAGEEMKKNGMKVGSMSLRLLEKIEELTLYTIDQQKQIEELESELSELESY